MTHYDICITSPKLPQSITDWILVLIVSIFVLIDLIILVTYTLFMWLSNDDGLRAEEIINAENPEDVEGVSSIEFRIDALLVAML